MPRLRLVVCPLLLMASCTAGPDQDPTGSGSNGKEDTIRPGDLPIQWNVDGRTVYVVVSEDRAARIDAIDLASGRRSPLRSLTPADRAGLIGVDFVLLSADARAYAYSYRRQLSVLYGVDGLR